MKTLLKMMAIPVKETYPSVILAVLFKARHAVNAAKGMALASYNTQK